MISGPDLEFASRRRLVCAPTQFAAAVRRREGVRNLTDEVAQGR